MRPLMLLLRPGQGGDSPMLERVLAPATGYNMLALTYHGGVVLRHHHLAQGMRRLVLAQAGMAQA